MRTRQQIMRRLWRSPGFTAAALVTIAMGIGANTLIFSVVNGVLLKPLPYPDSDRLISVQHDAPGVDLVDLGSSPFLFFTHREHNETFEAVGLWGTGTVSVTGVAEPEQVDALWLTHEVLPLLRAEPALGRYFSEADDLPSGAPTVVLTHAYWQRRFAGDPSIIGSAMTVDGRPYEVIGVMPESFRFLDQREDMLFPYQLDRNQATVAGGYYWNSLARLLPGVTIEQASRDVERMISIAAESFPLRPGGTMQQFRNARLEPSLRPLKDDVVGDIGGMLWVLMGTIGIVLLIACANVANLLLVRAESRQQEIAIRTALGAGWSRIARELLLESLVLGLLGGLLGLVLADAGLRMLLTFGPSDLPRLTDITIDSTVIGFTLLVSMACAFLFGAIPVVKYAGPRIAVGLKAGARALGGSRERHRARGALVTTQVGLALVLLISAGLMVRTFQALVDVDPGFATPDDVLITDITIPPVTVADAESVTRMQNDVLDRLAAIPGVVSVAFASSPPMGGSTASDLLVPEGRVFSEGDRPRGMRFKFISPGFFDTSGTPLVLGRSLTWTDAYEKRPVVLISENLARREWGSAREAMGKRLRGSSSDDDWREIVGVVGNVLDDGVARPAVEIVYLPPLLDNIYNAPTFAWRSVSFLIRSPRAGTVGLLNEVREAIWGVNPDLPLANVRTLGDVYEQSLARTSLTLVLLAIAGLMALVLGIVGIYAVVSYTVSQSTREIGIRMALGAQNRVVRTTFIGQALTLGTIGIVLGLAGAAGLARVMSSLLFGVSAVDPVTYVVVSGTLIVAVILASYVPARRATRVDPMQALRAE
jgi:predicted permease